MWLLFVVVVVFKEDTQRKLSEQLKVSYESFIYFPTMMVAPMTTTTLKPESCHWSQSINYIMFPVHTLCVCVKLYRSICVNFDVVSENR